MERSWEDQRKERGSNIFLSTYYILGNSVIGLLLILSHLILTELLQRKY